MPTKKQILETLEIRETELRKLWVKYYELKEKARDCEILLNQAETKLKLIPHITHERHRDLVAAEREGIKNNAKSKDQIYILTEQNVRLESAVKDKDEVILNLSRKL